MIERVTASNGLLPQPVLAVDVYVYSWEGSGGQAYCETDSLLPMSRHAHPAVGTTAQPSVTSSTRMDRSTDAHSGLHPLCAISGYPHGTGDAGVPHLGTPGSLYQCGCAVL